MELSRRDHIAAMAMQGFLAGESSYERVARTVEKFGSAAVDKLPESIANSAIAYADALISELDKTPDSSPQA